MKLTKDGTKCVVIMNTTHFRFFNFLAKKEFIHFKKTVTYKAYPEIHAIQKTI